MRSFGVVHTDLYIARNASIRRGPALRTSTAGGPRYPCKCSGAACHLRPASVGPMAAWHGRACRPEGLERGHPLVPGVRRPPIRYFWKNRDLRNSPAQPGLRISGWSCQQSTLPARRAAIGCMLNRLILLNAGNGPKPARVLIGGRARRWFSCNFFHPPDIIVRWCGRIDLVASPSSAKMMANRFGDRQPKRIR
jgi:hypothetical protein